MSFSYDPSLGSDLDTIRLYIGDTKSTDVLLQNEEINAILNIEINVYRTAAECALLISNGFARQVDESIGDHSKSYSKLSQQYKDLHAQLQAKVAKHIVAPVSSSLDAKFTRELP